MKRITTIALLLLLSMFEDAVATDNGFEIITSNYIINDIAFIGDNIWCATTTGVLKYNRIDNSATLFNESNGLIDYEKVYECVAIDQNGFVWCGASLGISMFDGTQWKSFKRSDNLLWNGIEDVAVDINNIIWFAKHSGIIFWDESEWGQVSSLGFDNMYIDNHNTKWFSGHRRRAKYDNVEMEYFEENEYDDFRYTCVAVDRNDVIYWGGTGLRIDDDDSIQTLDEVDGDRFEVSYIAIDSNNVKWFGATNGLWRYDDVEFQQILVWDDDNPYAEIRDIEIDEEGNIWFVAESYLGGGILAKYTPDRDPVSVQSTQPHILSILHSYPNPFNAETTLAFELPSDSVTRLAVYDCMGRNVRELLNGGMRAGRHTVLWDGRDESGVSVGSGVYFSRLNAGGSVANGRMVFVK